MWTRVQSSVTGTAVMCKHCGKESPLISQSLGLCSDCIRFLMADLPAAAKRQATECLEAARATGLSRVNLGNIHLLH